MKSFFKRLRHAFKGWLVFFQKETNGQIQLAIAAATVVLGFWLHLSTVEWMLILICIGTVIGFEMTNSALEKLCNHVQPELHQNIKFVKDVSAGAVLWAAVVSSVVGAVIFLPKLLALLA